MGSLNHKIFWTARERSAIKNFRWLGVCSHLMAIEVQASLSDMIVYHIMYKLHKYMYICLITPCWVKRRLGGSKQKCVTGTWRQLSRTEAHRPRVTRTAWDIPDECKPKVCHQLSSWLWSITTTSQTYHYFQTTHRTQIESFQLRLHCKDMSDPRPFKAPSPTSPSKRFPKLSRPRKVDWGCGV